MYFIVITNFKCYFRENEKSLKNLEKLLPENSKVTRRRRVLLNIHIAVVAWFLEVIGYLFGFLTSFVIQNNDLMRSFQIISSIIYFNIVPCSYLMSSLYIKDFLINNKVYVTFTNVLFSKSINRISPTK